MLTRYRLMVTDFPPCYILCLVTILLPGYTPIAPMIPTYTVVLVFSIFVVLVLSTIVHSEHNFCDFEISGINIRSIDLEAWWLAPC